VPMVWRFYVVDGADLKQFFLLPEQGTITIGRSRHADIILHDLYVGRVHCEVEADGERVVVRSIPDGGDILVNGKKVTEEELPPGVVLRVGNSHLRLERHLGAPEDEDDEEDVIEAEVDDEDAPPEPRKSGPLTAERLHELSGQSLSHYKLAEVLGRGHYGVVFRATDQKIGQPVAMKVLSAEFPQSAAEMQTFIAALKTLLPLRHPNLVTLYNAGKTGPYCWLALEPIEGESLATGLRDPDAKMRSHWKLALRMAAHLARALEFLRKHRLVHGNIAPANVLVRSDGVSKLADLMLSKALAGSTIQRARLEKKLLAELGYLAPEQTVKGAPVDALTDLYGVGAVVYARLTGRPPFRAATPEQTLELIQTSVPTRPKDVHKSIPDALSNAVMRLLSRRPEDRYETPTELLADLEALAEEVDVEL
jgi:serine/threonine protein kinase